MDIKYWIIRCVLLGLCLMPYSFVQAQQPSAADTSQAHSLMKLGHDFLEKEELDSAEFYYLRAGELSRKVGYNSGISSYIRYYLRILSRRGRYKEGLALSLEAVQLSKKLSKEELSIAYNNAGRMHGIMGQMEAAIRYYLKALKIAEATGNELNEMRFSNNLATVFADLADKEKCFQYASRGYQLAQDLNDADGMTYCLINIGNAEIMYKQYENANMHFHESLKLGKQIGRLDYVLVSYVKLGEIETEQENYPSALGYYQQGLHTLHYFPSPVNELYIYKGLASTYHNLELYDEAKHYLNKAIAISQAISNATERKKLYKLGSEIYEKLKDPATALELRKKYEALNDSMFSAQTQQNIHRLEIEYQTTQKEKEIAQQNLLIARTHLELERKNNLIYLSAAVLIGLLSALIIFYILYRNRQKANAERLMALERENELKVLMASVAGEEKERNRLARELHDGVGGILSATKMHLSVLRNEQDLSPHLHKFDQAASLLNSASREVRSIAHNLSPDLMLKYELDEALAIFCRSVNNDYLKVDFYALGEPLKLKNNFKFIIYRIVQELVNNILKHAEASHALVQLSHHDQVLSLTIEDNGKGFDAQKNSGMGLLNLKTRVQELNGQLNLETSPGEGTTIYMEFDLFPFINKDAALTSTIN